MDFHKWKRRKVRYWCFRLHNEANGGAPANGVPPGFKKHFEKQKLFTGWKNFAVNWDLPDGEATERVELKVVRRYKSVWEEWDEKLRTETTVLPGFEKGE